MSLSKNTNFLVEPGSEKGSLVIHCRIQTFPDLEKRGGGGRSPKNTFSALRTSDWSKGGGGAGP